MSEYPTYDEAMQQLSEKFARELKVALLQPYPFAPGFTKQRAAFGKANKLATGNLFESIEGNYNSANNEIVISMLDYWRYVNDGRSPGKYVPLNKIKEWIKARGLKGRDKKGRFITTESFAWGINTNIKKFGIAPTYFYDKATENFEKEFEDEAIKALGIDLQNFFEALFEENI